VGRDRPREPRDTRSDGLSVPWSFAPHCRPPRRPRRSALLRRSSVRLRALRLSV